MNWGFPMKKISLLTNENGSVIVLALIMLVLLTLLGMAVSRTTSIGVQSASNDSRAANNLYTAESADHVAIELTNTWMTDAFLLLADSAAYAVSPDLDGDGNPDVNYLDIDNDGNNDFKIEIRCVELTGTAINLLPPLTPFSNAANDLPLMRHISIPPVGSGYSLKYFEVRKYGITGTALDGGTVVQLGAYKVFNK
jgi:hypothetical protein